MSLTGLLILLLTWISLEASFLFWQNIPIHFFILSIGQDNRVASVLTEAKLSGFNSSSLTYFPRVDRLPFLGFCFLICKMEIVTALRGYYKVRT